MNLKKVVPKPPPPEPEWKTDPDDDRFEIQRGTGYKRTRLALPPDDDEIDFIAIP